MRSAVGRPAWLAVSLALLLGAGGGLPSGRAPAGSGEPPVKLSVSYSNVIAMAKILDESFVKSAETRGLAKK